MVIIEVHVKTRAKTTAIINNDNHVFYISLKAPPEHNKANKELIKFLKKTYNKEVTIIKGHTSRNKLIRLEEKDQ